MYTDFSELPEHRIGCSIIFLQRAAMDVGYPSSSSSSMTAMGNISRCDGQQRPIYFGRSEQRTVRSGKQRARFDHGSPLLRLRPTD
ncbi:hypothetical protein ACLOJK_018653 [Asimina triloba]